MEEKYRYFKTVEDLSELTGLAFERYLGQLFVDLGYDVIVTPASGDYGADLVLDGDEGKVVVQAKQYASPVGFSAIEEIHFAKTYYKADQAWVVATHGFTSQAVNAANAAGVRLISGTEVLEMSRAGLRRPAKKEKLDRSTIGSEIWGIARAVIKSKNGLDLFLQDYFDAMKKDELYSAAVMAKLEELGIVSEKNASGTRQVLVDEKGFQSLLDEKYDPSVAEPRYGSAIKGPRYDIFRGVDDDHVVLVENPTTCPVFYYFECETAAEDFSEKSEKELLECRLCGRWRCVGVDESQDPNDKDEVSRRLSKVAALKLLEPMDDYDLGHGGIVSRISAAHANTTIGKSEVVESGWKQRELDEEKVRQDEERRMAEERAKKEKKAAAAEMGCGAVLLILLFITIYGLFCCASFMRGMS